MSLEFDPDAQAMSPRYNPRDHSIVSRGMIHPVGSDVKDAIDRLHRRGSVLGVHDVYDGAPESYLASKKTKVTEALEDAGLSKEWVELEWMRVENRFKKVDKKAVKEKNQIVKEVVKAAGRRKLRRALKQGDGGR